MYGYVIDCFLAHSCADLWPRRVFHGYLRLRVGKKGEVLYGDREGRQGVGYIGVFGRVMGAVSDN